MKKMRRFIALFLCLVMLIPTQGISVLAETQQAGSSYDISDSGSSSQGEDTGSGSLGDSQAGDSDSAGQGEDKGDESGQEGSGQDGSQKGDSGNEGSENGGSADGSSENGAESGGSSGNEAESGGSGEDGSETGGNQGTNESEGTGGSGETGSGESGSEEPGTEESDSGSSKPSEDSEASKPSEEETGNGETSGTGNETEDGRVEETLPLEPIPPTDEDRIEETLPLDPIPGGTGAAGGAGPQVNVTLPLEKIEEEPEDPFIYWNPGNEVLVQLEDEIKVATSSNAEYADDIDDEDEENAWATRSEVRDASDSEVVKEAGAAAGKDRADGLSPEKPVRTLKAAMKRAEKLADSLDMELQDITIYAMNPMEVKPGDTETLKGKGITLASWPERSYDSDLIFYVNGGELVLRDVNLISGDAGTDLEDTALVRVDEGKVQLGAGVQAYGSFVLNYTDVKEVREWDTATASEATSSEIIENKNQDMIVPVIELLNGFTAQQQYYLSILGDEDGQYEVVRSLFADDSSEEEFLDMFCLSEYVGDDWTLTVKEEAEATVRNTESQSEESDSPVLRSRSAAFALTEVALTRKSLMATRAAGTPVYWNPGGAIEIGGITYPGGQDGVNDGSSPTAPVKTWAQARAIAYSGVIICMQPVDVAANPDEYIGVAVDGIYHIDGGSDAPVTIKAWEKLPQPAFLLPEGTALELENIVLQGAVERNPVQLIICDGGDLYLKRQVTTDYAYIQTIMSDDSAAKNHPVLADDTSSIDVELYYTEINENINYRYYKVVAPYGNLALEAETDPEAAGQKLLGAFYLSSFNSVTEENGGKSKYAWELRQDTDQDDMVEERHLLELYATFYYDAIYINGATGDDRNYGATCEYPVKTFARAKQILESAITESVTARGNAETEDERNRIAYPKTIYLCDTYAVNGTELWDLSVRDGSPFAEPGIYEDYNGRQIQILVQPHLDPFKDANNQEKHDVSETMIEIKGKLTVSDLTIFNNSKLLSSKCILVSEGGRLALDGQTIVRGDVVKSSYSDVKAVPIGIEIRDDASLAMLSTWTGQIDNHACGVNALGGTVTMLSGKITSNFAKFKTYQISGAGVVLKNDAHFVMKGGEISENNAYQHGGGVHLSGSESARPVFEQKGGIVSSNEAQYYGGGGVYVGQYAKAILENAIITKNKTSTSNSRGGGVFVDNNGEFIMKSGTISENKAGLNGSIYGYGGGIFAHSNLNVSGGVIENNNANTGAGIAVFEPDSRDTSFEVNIENAIVRNNSTYEGNSPGIWVRNSYATVKIKNSSVEGNTSKPNKLTVGEESAGGITIYSSSGPTEITDCIITANKGGHGGGIAASSAIVSNCIVKDNEAREGGGVWADGSVYIINTLIENNKAETMGGGVYGSCNFRTYLTDVQVVNNRAVQGGGINGCFVFDETESGKSALTGNYANFGGGIYTWDSNYSDRKNIINISNPIINTVGGTNAQGNNLYSTGKDWVLQADFRQPENYDEESEIYNVYQTNTPIYIDAHKVKIEGKNAIYLNSAEAYLCYLTEPESGKIHELPISVNNQQFSTGSIVIKPADISSLTYKSVNQNWKVTGLPEMEHKVDYPKAVTNASINLDYSRGGQLPFRQQLGGFPDSKYQSRINAVLVGQGVYLDGENGSDNNDGLSPETAVQTFQVAKLRLEENVDSANSDLDNEIGFKPSIFICGTVVIGSNESWELDYSQSRYALSKYVAFEEQEGRTPERAQIICFGSFIGDMIKVSQNTKLSLERIIIDGASKFIDNNLLGNRKMIICDTSSELILNGDTQLNNGSPCTVYSTGDVELNGNEKDINLQIGGDCGNAINIYQGKVVLNGYSRIDLTKTNGDGIGVGGNGQVYLNDNSSIFGGPDTGVLSSGIRHYIRESSDLTQIVEMSGASSIKNMQKGIVGTSVNMRIHMADEAKIENCFVGVDRLAGTLLMDGNASIHRTEHPYRSSGVVVDEYNEKHDTNIKLQDSASIGGFEQGIGGGDSKIARPRKSLLVELYDCARIYDAKIGISVSGYDLLGGSKVFIKLGEKGGNDNVTIDNCYSYGIEIINNIELELNANSKIHDCYNGVSMERLSKITLNDDAGIASNEYSGIRVFVTAVYSDELSYITMNDRAYIDGADKLKDNGINIASPTVLSMTGESQISGCGQSGIAVVPYMDFRFNNDSVIKLTDSAKVSGNTNGITCVDELSCIIELKGDSSVSNNIGDKQISVGKNTNLYLLEQSSVATENSQDAIYSNGNIYLAGTASVKGIVNLRDYTRPITLVSNVSNEQVKPKYYLKLAESFGGQVVVKPDGINVTDASSELGYFAATAEGSSKDKELLAMFPNIILSGENNVYLSGSGDDANNGRTPETAVRTFARAKYLLETGPYTEGANIQICGEVSVKEGDTLWSFGSGGVITNTVSNQTWQPKIMRYKAYRGRLISFNAKDMSDTEFRLENIIIDGNSENVSLTYVNYLSPVALLYIQPDSTVILGEGAILQNNRVIVNGNPSDATPGVDVKGELIIDGGVIRGLESEWQAEGYDALDSESGTAITVRESGKLSILRGNICNNYHLKGSVILVNKGEFVMEGGVIENNIADATAEGYSAERAGTIRFKSAKGNILSGMIRGNQAEHGAAISIDESTVIKLSGGQISNNKTISGGTAIGRESPVYIGSEYNIEGKFILDGGGCIINDAMYLRNTGMPITLSNNIWQTTRRYTVYLNQGFNGNQFKKGSAVVQPDNNMLTDASPYLQNFEVHSDKYILDRGQSETRSGGTIAGVMENKCLLLMQAVFIDSDNGDNNNTGYSPAQAVTTFKKAVEKGRAEGGESIKDYYVIYASGPIRNSGGESWSMEEPAYICRYTGFLVYGTDGEPVEQDTKAYFGQLVIPKEELTFENIRIYGRRSQDDTGNNGESLVYIPDGATLNMKGKSTLARNYNIGNYMGENHFENLSSKGGAVYVDVGGTFNLEAGLIEETAATYGGAVYQASSETEAERFGRFKISNSPLVSGSIYLDGTSDITAAYIEPEESYIPGMLDKSETKLTVAMRNDFDGRPIVKYPGGYVPGYTQTSYYQLDDAIKAVYDVINRPGEANVLQLDLRAILYLDGENGKDSNDGSTPEQAVGSIRRIYEILRDGGNIGGAEILVSGNVKIDGKSYITNKSITENNQVNYLGTYEDETGTVKTTSQVYFKRYVQPTAHGELEGYGVPTYKGSLLTVADGGDFVINGIYFDGHSQDTVGGIREIVAAGVEAEAPLIVVEEGGKVEVRKQEIADNVISTRNLFTNNVNIRSKSQVIGQLDGTDITEGSSAGIEILGGECIINGCDFQNLHLGEGVSGGTDVYQFGKATIGYSTVFGGSVFLEGFGTAEEKQETSHYLDISAHGSPVTDKFDVLIRDQYNGRTVAVYPDNGSGGASVLDIPYYRLGGTISDYYTLVRRAGNLYVFELNVPAAVYVDGVDGSDSNSGSNPKNPLQTMKQAYANMQKYSTGIVYIVGEVTFPAGTEVTMTGNGYIAGTDKITLSSTDKVEIRRYIKPDFAVNPADDYAELFSVEDYLGELFAVKDGVILNLGGNLTIDGHGNPRDNSRVPAEYMVSHETQVNMPLIEVHSGGVLNLNRDAVLMDNYNTQENDSHVDGGAVANHGTTNLNGARLTNNMAAKGAGIYQDGTFTITERPEGISGQGIYLTAGAVEDHMIQTTVKFGDDVILDVNMDNAVKGRDVVRFLTKASYAPNADVDAEHIHFRLGSTVPADLFLVKALEDPEVLELQNWEVLDVEVPEEIYLVVQKRGVKAASVTDEMLESPLYRIKNHGIYDVNVSLTGFLNENSQAGIAFAPMNLVGTAAAAIGDTDLYLSVVGEADGAFSAMGEVALDAFGTEEAAIQAFGRLAAGTEGGFTFKGTASEAFITKYMDSTFPYTGKTAEEMRQYIKDNARAKYKMTYKIEMDPARR